MVQLGGKKTLATMRSDHVGRLVDDAIANGRAVSSRTFLGQVLKRQGVARTAELKRIAALPRRDWEKDEALGEVVDHMTRLLLMPEGAAPCSSSCEHPRALWPNQAVALLEATVQGGAFCPIRVGRGKALVSLLAPVAMRAKRPLLLVPAQLRDQTLRKVLPATRRHWRLHPELMILGYSELSLAKNKRILLELRPDLIILDEAHEAKNRQSARHKRLLEYLEEEPLTRVIVLSGSLTTRSLRDYERLLRWALKPDRCPLPSEWKEVQEWAMAIDEDIPEDQRIPAGALVLLSNDPADTTRDLYRKRLVETPGVVATSEADLAVSLRIVESSVAVPGRVQAMMDEMRRSWETPAGDFITEAIDLWRHMRELACGFFYRWDPFPPSDWLDARRAWKKYVRETIRNNRVGLDSELVVANYLDALVKSGHEKADTEGVEVLRAWRAVRDTFEINTVAEWVDDFALQAAFDWACESIDEEHPDGGIVWIEHVAFGERLSEFAKHAFEFHTGKSLPYFGAGMKASAEILDHSGPMIASISAHSQGKNLQRWSKNLVTAPPSSGRIWEQLVGRTHREGQKADTVEAGVWLHADELRSSFQQARNDARYIEQTLGSRQKLCFADIITREEPRS